jgi:hypothetical protein
MGSRALLLALAPVCLACQLVDPSSGLPSGVSDSRSGTDSGARDGSCGANAFCDDFDRSVAIPAGSAVWLKVVCDESASLGVAPSSLEVTYPMNDGSAYSQCYLASASTPAIDQFQLDFDLTFHTSPSGTDLEAYAVLAFVDLTLPEANARGIDGLNFQLLVDAKGEAQLLAVFHYPNASLSPIVGNNYPSFALAARYAPMGAWLAPGAACHVSVSVDSTVPSGTATATCGGTPVSMLVASTHPPPGIAAPAALALGYSHSQNNAVFPMWSLDYRNLVLRWTPSP